MKNKKKKKFSKVEKLATTTLIISLLTALINLINSIVNLLNKIMKQ